MTIKTTRKFFAAAEFLEEERFLEQMHKDGWKFKTLNGMSKYEFEECPNEEYRYQLEFNNTSKNEDSYLQMYQDYGWEYIEKFGHWYYFRKPKGIDSDDTIFSDNTSKIEMIKKINNQQLLALSIACIVTALWFIISLPASSNQFIIILGIIFWLEIILIISIFTRNLLKLRKLKKTIEEKRI